GGGARPARRALRSHPTSAALRSRRLRPPPRPSQPSVAPCDLPRGPTPRLGATRAPAGAPSPRPRHAGDGGGGACDERPRNRSRSADGPPTTGAGSRRMRVLIVEDDDAIAVPLAKGLAREGLAVERVETGSDALGRAAAGDPFDVVLLDLGL